MPAGPPRGRQVGLNERIVKANGYICDNDRDSSKGSHGKIRRSIDGTLWTVGPPKLLRTLSVDNQKQEKITE